MRPPPPWSRKRPAAARLRKNAALRSTSICACQSSSVTSSGASRRRMTAARWASARQLHGSVRDQQPPRARRRERLDRLLGREMAARVAVVTAVLEGRLAEKEVGVARELGELVRRRGVARVRERRSRVRDAKPVRLDLVVRHAERRHLEPGGAERLTAPVLPRTERLLEHLRYPEPVGELVDEGHPTRREPQLRRRD